MSLKLERETSGKAVEIADGFWLIATRHRPGLSKRMFEINNRCLIFRLREAGGGPVLLVANAVDPTQAIDEVRRLERETGLRVRYILSVGGGHHLHMDGWIEAFPEAKFLLPPVRVPRTRHGTSLMQKPQVAVMNLDDPLPQFRGQLDALVFYGLVGFPDHMTPGEGGSDGIMSMMKMMAMMMKGPADPVDELWLRHVPTGTVIAGENLAWYYPAEEYRKLPFMGRKMLKPDKVWLMEMARRVKDAGIVAACWKKVLAWPMSTLMTYHDPPTRAITADPHAALEGAVREAKQII
ncbi:MAG TPA: hypothetical protein VFH73_00565 [Polyangia bacterium]|jgi:hypothetical protein|nr:hypothetical protein [Polyangia bacterium]